MPTSCSAFFTSSSLNGLIIASSFFIASHLALSSTGLLDCLAMKREVETFAFNFGVDPKADRKIDHFEQDQRDDDVIDDRHSDPVELHEHLMRIAVDQAALAFAANPCNSEHPGEDCPDHAADAMHAKGVEAVVVSECVLEAGRGPIADDAGGNADDQGAPRVDK